jgi:S-adenosylmethionine hydrolase
LEGEVIHIDHFGNALTSLGQFIQEGRDRYKLQPWIGSTPQMMIQLTQAYLQCPNQRKLSYAKTFADISKDACKFILGSSGLIEIAANRQSAADLLDLKLDDKVNLHVERKTNNRSTK